MKFTRIGLSVIICVLCTSHYKVGNVWAHDQATKSSKNLVTDRDITVISTLKIGSEDFCKNGLNLKWMYNACMNSNSNGYFITGSLENSTLSVIRLSVYPDRYGDEFVEFIVGETFTGVHLPNSNNLKFNAFNDLDIFTSKYNNNELPKIVDILKKHREDMSKDTDVQNNFARRNLNLLDYMLSKNNKVGNCYNHLPSELEFGNMVIPIATAPLLKVHRTEYKKMTISNSSSSNNRCTSNSHNGNEEIVAVERIVVPFFIYIENQKMIFGSGIPGKTKIYPMIGLQFDSIKTPTEVGDYFKRRIEMTMLEDSTKNKKDVSINKIMLSEFGYTGYWGYNKDVKLLDLSFMCGYEQEFADYSQMINVADLYNRNPMTGAASSTSVGTGTVVLTTTSVSNATTSTSSITQTGPQGSTSSSTTTSGKMLKAIYSF
ncbi:hypothetical protein AX774_g2359 [Zancudomyces culisetae]|uniref:Uncharacterized protein n=1 Tax=Zancudomyces culisetae TaxID=1213189 RepID=A0A1R1PTB3_ZANCU|nr:hypothetical protein AX774_g2359 [Zancudomyces culisetae]|eukprot:OMH84132.1 hypothetical protein AX774_g2359 [Zancudomyces culisetae]